MSLLKNLGLASSDADEKLENALLTAAGKVIAGIILPGLDDRQNLELQATIRQAVKEDDAPKIRAAFASAVQRIEALCKAKVEIARIEGEIKILRQLEVPDVSASDPLGLLARAVARERMEIATSEIRRGEDALAEARQHMRDLQASPLVEQPQRAYTPEPWPRKVEYLKHLQQPPGSFEDDDEDEEGPEREFTSPFIRSKDLARV